MYVLPQNSSFSLVSEKKVLTYLNSLGINEATSLDSILSRFAKDESPVIVGLLTHINLSLLQGVVPEDLKSARVVSLFRENNKLFVGNYRPVSTLNIA